MRFFESHGKRLIPYIAGFLTILLVLFITGYFLSGSRSKAVRFAPSDSYAFVYVKPDLLQLSRLAMAQKYFKKDSGLEKRLNELFSGLNQSKRSISFGTDIQPWLGEEVAVLLIGPGDEKQPLFIIATEDDYSTREFLQSLSVDGYQISEQHHNVAIYMEKASGRAFAISDGFLLFGSPQSIRMAIDTSQGLNPSLQNNAKFCSLLETLPYSRTLTGYIRILPVNEPANLSGRFKQWADIAAAQWRPDNKLEAAAFSAAMISGGIQLDVAACFLGTSSLPQEASSLQVPAWSNQDYTPVALAEQFSRSPGIEPAEKEGIQSAMLQGLAQVSMIHYGILDDQGRGLIQIRLMFSFKNSSKP